MPLLNEPLGYEEREPDPEWSPAIGFRRAVVHGAVAAAVLSLLLAPLAAFLPYVILPWVLRTPLTFGVAWLLFVAIERAAGFVGPRIVALMMLYTLAVLASNHVVFALHGVLGSGLLEEWWLFPAVIAEHIVPVRNQLLIGWEWLHPYVVGGLNAIPLLIGGGFCAALKGRG